MGTTSNYSWPYPESSDYVADGATAIENLADAVDTTVKSVNDEIDDLIPTAPSWFPNTGSWAPEYGTGYYRSGLYTISAPAGKSINIVQLTVTAQTNYNPAWLTVSALSTSSVSYYVYCKGYAAGFVLCHLDCR